MHRLLCVASAATPETRERCDGIFSVLARLRTLRRLPFDLQQLINNTIYACKPAEGLATVVDERPRLHRYIERLILEQLDRDGVDRVVRQLRRLPWSQVRDQKQQMDVVRVASILRLCCVCGAQVGVEDCIITALLDCACVKYHAVDVCACVISALCRHHEDAMLRAVDGAIERGVPPFETESYHCQSSSHVCAQYSDLVALPVPTCARVMDSALRNRS